MDNALIIEHRGALVEITLNRPKVMNALNDEMREAIAAALPGITRDPEVYAVILRSNGERAFCAGGDVRELTTLALSDPSLAAASIRQEYTLNWALECFSKPTVALIDGMVMGSGVGLVLYNTHRVAGEGFSFAMPETTIGLFPDVGVSCVLAKLPGHIGRYLGLSGRSIDRATAYRLGLVTHCINSEHFAAITAGLEAADTVDPILDSLHEAPGEDELARRAVLIDDVFGASTIASIFAGLERIALGTDVDAEWCEQLLTELKTKSPVSLAVTLRHLDECRDLELREVLIRDYRLAVRFLDQKDFQEGVRALLIDKDGRPNWQHSTINDVQLEEIEKYFTPLTKAELDLPDRSEMQDLRG